MAYPLSLLTRRFRGYCYPLKIGLAMLVPAVTFLSVVVAVVCVATLVALPVVAIKAHMERKNRFKRRTKRA